MRHWIHSLTQFSASILSLLRKLYGVVFPLIDHQRQIPPFSFQTLSLAQLQHRRVILLAIHPSILNVLRTGQKEVCKKKLERCVMA